jgi:hypothetical protein
MTTPHHNSHPEAPDKENTSVNTPDVGKSSIVKIGIFAFLTIVILIILTMVITRFNKEGNKNEGKTEVSQKPNIPAYSSTYNLSKIEYGSILKINIAPYETIRVNLTNDWCPMFSDKEIRTFDSQGVDRVLYHTRYTEGPPSTPSTYYIFSNENNSTVLVKIGRCESVNDCNIQF